MKAGAIDGGGEFDFGRTSEDYAKYRDIYPDIFYEKILSLGLCKDGQNILDIGTGTGVLPRNMYRYGAKWMGTDISAEQIEQAKILAKSAGMDITFRVCPAEKLDYPENSFDAVTACQCIWYPDHKRLAPLLAKMIKPEGKFLILYMAWLPYEEALAARSEEVILRYNPGWSGAGETRKPVLVPEEYQEYFDITRREEFDVKVPFTRESWHGRLRACRGTAASMDADTLARWDAEHRKMLEENAPERFDILHFVSMAELTLKRKPL